MIMKKLTKRSKFGKIADMKITGRKLLTLAIVLSVVGGGSVYALNQPERQNNTTTNTVVSEQPAIETPEPIVETTVEQTQPVEREVATTKPVPEAPKPSQEENKAWYVAQIKANVAKLGLAPDFATENFMWWQGVCAERGINKHPDLHDTRSELEASAGALVDAYFTPGTCRVFRIDT